MYKISRQNILNYHYQFSFYFLKLNLISFRTNNVDKVNSFSAQ